MLLGHPEFLHDRVARGAEAEAVDGEDLAVEADVFPPQAGDGTLLALLELPSE